MLEDLASGTSRALSRSVKSKYQVGDRVMYVCNGKRFKQTGSVHHVRKDGLVIVQFDTDLPGAFLVVQPLDIVKVEVRS